MCYNFQKPFHRLKNSETDRHRQNCDFAPSKGRTRKRLVFFDMNSSPQVTSWSTFLSHLIVDFNSHTLIREKVSHLLSLSSLSSQADSLTTVQKLKEEKQRNEDEQLQKELDTKKNEVHLLLILIFVSSQLFVCF